MHISHIQIGSHVIHEQVSASGQETSIILVHGLGVSGKYFEPFAEHLSKHYDVYNIDLPGYGKTSKPYPALTITELSDVLLDYIEEKRFRKVILIGQSMGCQIVAHAGAKNPSMIHKMILLAPSVNKNERNAVMQTYRLIQDIFHEPISATALVFGEYIRMGIRRYIQSANYMLNDHIEQTLQYYTQPVLIVRGKKDKIVPYDWATHLSRLHQNYVLKEMADAPHLLHYKKPQELVSICRRFIEE